MSLICAKSAYIEGETLSFDVSTARILSVVRGQLTADDGAILQRGDNALLPASHEFNYTAHTEIEVLITENFANA